MNTALNLLPWRARRRQRRWRHSLIALAVSMLAGSILWRWLDTAAAAALYAQRQHNLSISGQLDELNARLAALEQQAQQQRALVSAYAQREHERLALVQLLDALARQTPEGVFLTEARRQSEILTFTAHAATNAQIASTMQQWNALGAQVSALSLISASKTDGNVFTLSIPWSVTVAGQPVQFVQIQMDPAR